MENNQNEKNLQQEKLKLHFTYIVVICFIICIGTVILAAHNQETFVSQISFAGTITSIVLSILAIWLSMSGERTTNDIRIKISESTERLSETTKNVENLNKNYETTMNTQLNELKNVQEQLKELLNSVGDIREQVHTMQGVPISPNEQSDNSKIIIFENIHRWIQRNYDYDSEWVFCQMIESVIHYYNTSGKFDFTDIIKDLKHYNVPLNYYARDIENYWGVINTLAATSLFYTESQEIKNLILPILDRMPFRK